MAAVSLSKEALEAYVVSANDVVLFKLVMTTDDIEDDDIAFHPEMSHQIFGEGESIFGYRDLQVKLYYACCSLTPYLGMSYTEKIDLKKSDGLKADDVLKTVLEKLPSGVHTNIDEFVSLLPKETAFRPFGELLHSFKIGRGGLSRTFELYSASVTTPGFLDYHARMQSFILWFIDAASYIDSDDEKWEYFVLVQILCLSKTHQAKDKKQARRVYEILRLRATNTANASQYKAYRLEVKNRLNAPYQKQKADVEKLQRTMSPEEFRATLQCLNAENRIEQLESQYRDLEMEYRRTIERLAVAPRS
ncbi:hypothetical protein HPB50_024679 [Hyalomma asiaticum]|uniref:Uncharacterized protein n=1 Tax=Hyalomma asiaticum TaxID=266040 RepID=A0ACB7S8H1_HYAAI|nr:hypothetical protein HPB50_024679 [Hyalomma asiaticum]